MKPLRSVFVVTAVSFSFFFHSPEPVLAFDEVWPYEEFYNPNDCELLRQTLEAEQNGDFGLITSELGRGFHPSYSAQVSFYCYHTKGQTGALVYKVMKSFANYYYYSTIGPETLLIGRHAGTQYEDVYMNGLTQIENGLCNVSENGLNYESQYIRKLSVTTATPVAGYWPEGQGDQWTFQPVVGQPLVVTNYINEGEDSQGNCVSSASWSVTTTEYDDWSQLASFWYDVAWWLEE